jgi:ABC-2 type transport system permease protein
MISASHVSSIFKKELRGYFVTPIAYIVIAIFLVLTGWFFFSTFFLFGQAELRSFFTLLPIIFAFIIPAVTMRLFSEEYNIGSYEILATLPVSINEIILGKFLAGAAFVAVMLLPTVSYAIFVAGMGDLDWGPVIGGFIGALLLGSAFVAIGLFASSLTKNQIIAFIIGMVICFALTIVDKLLFFLPERMLGFFQFIGAGYHFENAAKGILDSRDIVYFISAMFIALYATNLKIQEKR